uniref:Uncharacterized protein LOC105051346 isoform X3 n=1 Tax=Elaeis guineensis var. tenera TaxID=51953 RepID=A0A6I9RP27_ELAGV|nr:uncharacterized protein LOC105051346 isoform X3 [Elaeis guineensis]
MGRRVIEIALLLLLSLSLHGARARQEAEGAAGARSLLQEVARKHEVHCSRERSRTAWKIIEEYLMPFVDQEQYQISSKCRLHPDNDMFHEQEQHKIHVDTNEWRCGFCKKAFRAEKFLDQHFDNRHYNLLNDTQGRCLADLCGALHCDQMADSKKTKTKCNPAAAARNRHLCEIVVFRLTKVAWQAVFMWGTKTLLQRGQEAIKRILPCCLHIDSDASTTVLSFGLFASKRDEEGHSRSETYIKNNAQVKAILGGKWSLRA